MKAIEAYKIAWNTETDEGIFMLQTEDNIEQVLVDSAAEGSFLLDILRNEKPVYLDGKIIFTGFEVVGEGENDTEEEEEGNDEELVLVVKKKKKKKGKKKKGKKKKKKHIEG